MELRRRVRTVSAATESAVMTAGERLIQEGLEQGLERGRREGMLHGRIELLRRQLERRFGTLSPATAARLAAASLDELDAWALRLLDARTLDEVFVG
jgi:hypothetical protein